MPASKSQPDAVLRKLRDICLSLPGAAEVTKWRHPNFVVGKKVFAVYEKYKGEWAICFKAEAEQQRFLVDTFGPRFYVTPYVGKHGWVSMKVEPGVRWPDVKRFVKDSYALVVET
jgi:predicted DNA-binding protein (MmcQ/YjbR family)